MFLADAVGIGAVEVKAIIEVAGEWFGKDDSEAVDVFGVGVLVS